MAPIRSDASFSLEKKSTFWSPNGRGGNCRLLRPAKLPESTRFHDLRHTAASLALAAGTHAKVVQEMLGHASIALTLDTYSHTIPSMGREAAERLDTLLAEAP